MFRKTGTVTVLSDRKTVDEYGDEVDDYDVVASGVSVHIGQKSHTYFDPQSSRVQTIRQHRALLPPGTQVKSGYRLKDEKSGTFYYIEQVHIPNSSVGTVPVRVDLKTVE